MDDSLDRLQARLQFRFRDPLLLVRALTHRSASADHNERLEYLGDAILNASVASLLVERYPEASEGRLTRMRSKLVRKESLARFARELHLDRHLNLGGGMLKSGAHQLDSVLEDALEAVLGAAYLDAGFEACRQLVATMMKAEIDVLGEQATLRDPKTRLQEHLQAEGLPLPRYRLKHASGPGHDQEFVVSCEVEGVAGPAMGRGRSRRLAEQDAAGKILAKLEQQDA